MGGGGMGGGGGGGGGDAHASKRQRTGDEPRALVPEDAFLASVEHDREIGLLIEVRARGRRRPRRAPGRVGPRPAATAAAVVP
jgi:hypothetical protein